MPSSLCSPVSRRNSNKLCDSVAVPVAARARECGPHCGSRPLPRLSPNRKRLGQRRMGRLPKCCVCVLTACALRGGALAPRVRASGSGHPYLGQVIAHRAGAKRVHGVQLFRAPASSGGRCWPPHGARATIQIVLIPQAARRGPSRGAARRQLPERHNRKTTAYLTHSAP